MNRNKSNRGGAEKRKLATGSTSGQSYNPGMGTYPMYDVQLSPI